MESVETGDEIRSCSRSSQKLIFTCLTCKNVQRLRNGPVHEFYGLKASQMSKVRASSHEYLHVEKIKNLCEQNLKGAGGKQQATGL